MSKQPQSSPQKGRTKACWLGVHHNNHPDLSRNNTVLTSCNLWFQQGLIKHVYPTPVNIWNWCKLLQPQQKNRWLWKLLFIHQRSHMYANLHCSIYWVCSLPLPLHLLTSVYNSNIKKSCFVPIASSRNWHPTCDPSSHHIPNILSKSEI